MAKPATRHDRRRAQTREVLVAAGRSLIASRGLAELRIQDITEEADVALGTFYNYFPSKRELVEAVITDSLEELVRTIVVDTPDQDPAVTASAAIRRVVGLAFEDPEFARVVVNLHNADTLFSTAFHPFAQQVVVRGVESGRFDSPDIEVSVNLSVGSSISLMRRVLDGLHERGVEQTHAELSLRALGIPHDEARKISQLPLT